MEQRKAYVTTLSTDSYLLGVIALFESLKRTQPRVTTFIVVVNENIKQKTKEYLLKEGYHVIERKSVTIPKIIKIKNSISSTSNWNYTFDKFNVFELDEIDKIVYLDSDMYINKNIDKLFDKPHMSAVAAGKSYPGNENWNELNSGIMVIEPKKGIINEFIKTMIKISKPNIKMFHIFKYMKQIKSKGDQDIIEEYYNWKNYPELQLDEKYNVFVNYVDYYIREMEYSKEDLAIIHFVGNKKPWLLSKEQLEDYREDCKRKNNIFQLEFFDKYIEIIKSKENKFI